MGPVDVSRSADLETEVQICPNGLLKLEIPFCFSLCPFPPAHVSPSILMPGTNLEAFFWACPSHLCSML